MIFTVEKKNLQMGLNAVKNGLNKKDLASIFATNIQVIAKGDSLSFVTTNGETHYAWKSSVGVSIEQEGSIAVNADKLLSALPHLPEDKVSFSLNSNLLNVKSGKIVMELKTISDKSFGKVSEIETPISLKGETSTAMFRRIIHTLNRDPAKPRMLGLLLDFKSDGDKKTVVFKSVSPTRASRYNTEFESAEPINAQVVMPCYLVDEAAKHNLIKLGFNKANMVAVFDNNLTVTSPLQENVFINPDQVFDANDTWQDIKFNREDLGKAISFIKSMSDKQDKKARIAATGDGAVEISSYTDSGKSKIALLATYGDKPNFAFNSEHLAELLTALDDGDVELKVGGNLLTYATPNYKFVTSLSKL